MKCVCVCVCVCARVCPCIPLPTFNLVPFPCVGKVDSLSKELKTVQEERNDLEEKYRHVSSQLQV